MTKGGNGMDKIYDETDMEKVKTDLEALHTKAIAELEYKYSAQLTRSGMEVAELKCKADKLLNIIANLSSAMIRK